jgi:hypothetical protein
MGETIIRRMSRISILAVTSLLANSAAATAASPPSGLFGKSVIVEWSETRVQRTVGAPNFTTIYGDEDWNIYISTEGRVFSCATSRSKGGTGSTEQVAGDAGAWRVPKFHGTSLDFLGHR